MGQVSKAEVEFTQPDGQKCWVDHAIVVSIHSNAGVTYLGIRQGGFQTVKESTEEAKKKLDAVE